MVESTLLEALTAELLGDVGKLHADVKQLAGAIPDASETIKNSGAEAAKQLEVAVQGIVSKFEESSEELAEKIEGARIQIIELASMTPKMLLAAETRLEECTEKQILRIEKAHANLDLKQKQFIDSFAVERNELKELKVQLDSTQLEIFKASALLEKEKSEFNSLGFWARVFARA